MVKTVSTTLISSATASYRNYLKGFSGNTQEFCRSKNLWMCLHKEKEIWYRITKLLAFTSVQHLKTQEGLAGSCLIQHPCCSWHLFLNILLWFIAFLCLMFLKAHFWEPNCGNHHYRNPFL